MDYRIYHAVNDFVSQHAWLGRIFQGIEAASIPVFVVAAVALWLLARPGAGRRWKLASLSALAAAAVALVVNRVIAAAWERPRPFAGHPGARVFGARSTDPSFPSDHSSASFAIAFAVLVYDRVAGALFLAAAILVGWGRVMVGEHYPGDVLAGALIGAAAGILVARLARPLLVPLARLVERVTNPLVAPVWRRVARGRL